MPPMSRRADALLAGQTLTPSTHHVIFAALEFGKLLLLTRAALLTLLTPQ